MHWAQGGCQVYLHVHWLGGWSVRPQMHRKHNGESSECDLGWMSTIMFTEAVRNATENDAKTYQIVYRIVSWETVTNWHCEDPSPNGIMRNSWDNYREMMTEHSDQDLCQMTPNWDSIRGLSGALSSEGINRDVYLTADRNECRTTILEA